MSRSVQQDNTKAQARERGRLTGWRTKEAEWDWKPTTADQRMTVAQLARLADNGSPTPISGDATTRGGLW